MSLFGVHSEVGRLRKVIVHRPELSLQRLTPANCAELLFDDVLWVDAPSLSMTPLSRSCALEASKCITSWIC